MSPRIRVIILLAGDVLLIALASTLASNIRLGWGINVFAKFTGASIFTLSMYVLSLYVFDLYNSTLSPRKDYFLRLTVALAVGGILSSFLFYSLQNWQYGRDIFALQAVLVWIFLGSWRKLLALALRRYIKKEPALVVGDGECSDATTGFLDQPESPYEIMACIDLSAAEEEQDEASDMLVLSRLPETAKAMGAKTLILTTTKELSQEVHRILLRAHLGGLKVLEMPSVYERWLGRIPVRFVQERWLLLQGGYDLVTKDHIQRIKIIADKVLATAALLLTWPILLLVALAIRIDSPGPILFRQQRVGKNEEIFTIYKFRTMQVNTSARQAKWASDEDPRVTKVGRFLRKFRIDETPQLLNILKGEMSLVGPRPEQPEFVAQLEKQIPYYAVRHVVKPGLTGWAQINYRYGNSEADALVKLEYELYYIKNMSLMLDLRILLKTLGVVLFGQGAN